MEKIQKGKTFQLSTSIDYAEGGIVSKEIIRNESGTVTLFSFDAGQGLSEHFAPYDVLLSVFEGEMELNVENTIHTIKKGECFIIPSGARHAVKAKQRFKMTITMIRENKQ